MTNMMIPRRHNFFDDFMMSPFDAFFDTPTNGKSATSLMKTDVKETEDSYELTIDIPGVEKENVTAELKNGYLKVTAETHRETEDKDEKGTYLRKERFEGSCSRSFYVGSTITEEDIKAKFGNGTLLVTVPKKSKKELEEKKTIAIEG
jgi:HSP20 family protein